MIFTKYVRPLETQEIEKFKQCLNNFHPKYGILFLIGLESGLRISDLLNLRVEQFKHKSGIIHLKEIKTRKEREIELSSSLMESIKNYCKTFKLNGKDFLVFRSAVFRSAPISRQRVYVVFKKCAEFLRMRNIATHSMRKTFAMDYYQKHGIEATKKILNHSKIEYTMMYLLDGVR